MTVSTDADQLRRVRTRPAHLLRRSLLSWMLAGAVVLAMAPAKADDPTTPRSFSPDMSSPSAPSHTTVPNNSEWAHLPNTPRDLQSMAEHGNVLAATKLGIFYFAGLGVTKNYDQAAIWLRKGADNGYPLAEELLGTLYENGYGVTKDYGEALKWHRKAADQKLSGAENSLGSMYATGRGVPRDFSESIKWFRLAASHGNFVALNNLGISYQAGYGVPRDNLAAYFWYTLAAAKLPANQNVQAVRNRDMVEKLLTPEQISRAQEAARDWKPGMEVAIGNPAGEPPPEMQNPARSSGSGFFVTKSGYIITNAHVTDECKQIVARRPGDADSAATLVASDKRNDLALLKIDAKPARVAAFREDRGVRQGDNVIAYGFPLLSTGIVATDGNLTTGTVSALAGMGNDTRFLQITAPVQAGNSGGPLVDASGNVIGIVTAKANALMIAAATGDVPQNINFAIKSSVMRDFLDANGVAYVTAKSAADLKTADIGERTRQFTVIVECRG
ncbi:MAG TPA: trypsin-like peptidase domain-containing protein [Candidatus Cybelea sp.]|nr:trypsin-like peptidase domain-containing protein [Candidatus Cybelea sp.]